MNFLANLNLNLWTNKILQGLDKAVIATGECYEEIGSLYEEQPRLDWEHIQDMMHDYKGLLAGWPQVLQIHSVAIFRDLIVQLCTFDSRALMARGRRWSRGAAISRGS